MHLTSPEPIASRKEAVKRHLRDLVETGVLATGARVPSIRALTRSLGVGKNTVIAALDDLCGEGVLEPRERSGFFVRKARRAPSARLVRLEELRQDRVEHGIASVVSAPEDDNLASGCGPASLLATPEWEAALRAPSRGERPFGAVDPQGDPRLREAIAHKEGILGPAAVDPERVLVTHGASEGLNLACAEAAAATGVRRVAVESPGYYMLGPMLRQLGLEPVPVRRTLDGLDLEGLRQEVHRGRLAAVVTIPNHHNPLGSTLALKERFELAALAERSGFFLVEDDVYKGLWTEEEEPVALQALAPERTFYVGSFSKTLGMSLRLGFVIAPAAMVRPLRNRKFALNLAEDARTQRLVAGFLERRAYLRHLSHLRGELARRARLAEVQAEAFRGLGAFEGPFRGGFFRRFRFAEGIDPLRLYERAREVGTLISPGAFFHLEGDPAAEGARWMRVSIAGCDRTVLSDALTVLRRLAAP